MNKPVFSDEFAKTKLREHKTFGGKTVEILYGAKDENGNPCAPRDDAADGHGVWSGIVVNGDDYRMFVWKHSEAEGGAVEYGTEAGENALSVMESEILQKRDLARQAEIVTRSGNIDEEEMNRLKAEWAALTEWNVPTENEYKARFDKAMNEFGPRVEAIKANKTLKEEIVAKATALMDSENFKNALNELNKLKEQISNIGYAGEENEDSFRKAFRTVETTLRTKQKEFYNNLDASRAAAEEKKNEIIEETKKLIENVKSYKDTNNQLNALFDAWKAAGSAGHERDEKLWTIFNTLRQEFYDARKKFFDDRNEQWKLSIDKKKALIEEAQKISDGKDYSKTSTERMKQLDKEWRQAGFSGKELNDSLWDEFTKAKEVFWEAKKSQFTAAVQGDLDKASNELNNLKKQLEDIEYKVTVAVNPSMKRDAENELNAKKAEIDKKETQIEDLNKKISN